MASGITRVCAIGMRAVPGGAGGIETHCQQLYTRLAAADGRLEFILLTRSPYGAEPQAIAPGVRVVPLWSLRHKFLETLFHTPVALFYARLVLRPDIVHLHALGPAFFTPLAKLLGFKVIVTHHAADYARPKWSIIGRWFLRAGETAAARFADSVVCVADFLRCDLVRLHPSAAGKTRTIRNGASMPDGYGDDAVLASLGLIARSYIIAVGRLDRVKGFHDLIAAYKKSRLKGRKLVIVGGAFVRDRYAQDIEAEASDDIVIAGFRSRTELASLYRNACLLVHPSYMEGYSLVVTEALAAGTPVLISDIPAHREFELEENCYFGAGDVDALALRLADDAWLSCSRSTAVRILQSDDWNLAARELGDCIRALSDAAEPRALAPENSHISTVDPAA